MWVWESECESQTERAVAAATATTVQATAVYNVNNILFIKYIWRDMLNVCFSMEWNGMECTSMSLSWAELSWEKKKNIEIMNERKFIYAPFNGCGKSRKNRNYQRYTNEFKICMSTFLCDTQPPALNACAVVGNETSQ